MITALITGAASLVGGVALALFKRWLSGRGAPDAATEAKAATDATLTEDRLRRDPKYADGVRERFTID